MRKVFLVIVIIAFLATGGFLFKDYAAQSAAAGNLTAQLAIDTKELPRALNQTQNANAEIAALTQSLADLDKAIAAENSVIPGKINPNEIVRNILTLGEKYKLNIIPFSTQEWTKVKVGKHDYSVFTMNLKVTGDQSHLMDFVKQLDPLYRTLIIKSLSISKPAEVKEAGVIEAELKLAIYTTQ